MSIDPQAIQDALENVRNEHSFINELLVDTLNWPVPEVEALEDISYDWTQADLNAKNLDKKVVDGRVRQLQPLDGEQPWGIFLLEFKNADAFTKGHGLTGPLRQVLRGLVPKRTRDARQPVWNREHLLFICTHNYEHYRFAYFTDPSDNGKTAPLATFGWSPEEPARTVCELNLPQLKWPEEPTDTGVWVTRWASAFDIEKVTQKFYADYARMFSAVERQIIAPGFSEEDVHLFTQSLFNRLMFLRFIERKRWLHFNDASQYLRALFEAGGLDDQSFYRSRLCTLFFEGLGSKNHQSKSIIGEVPFLNGGLFERTDLDRREHDIPDAAFQEIIGPEGLFYRYNFTIEESTPFDVEVAVDPEMLGKVFEELVTGRHETGSYYTPRPVVSFMCREALKTFLANKVSAPVQAINKLIDESEVQGLNEAHAKLIQENLESLKVVDPACGSGAYLLGLLQEIIRIRRLLQSERLAHDPEFLYNLKLHIISQNLHGVDNDPFAIGIAKLRLWLSLAVEAFAPVPLPNLDFKIETGDALLGPNPQEEVGAQDDIFRRQMRTWTTTLVNLKDKYLRSTGRNKERLRSEIERLERRIREMLEHSADANVIDWYIQFADVFSNNEGFDIVLANPPYRRHELIGPAKAKLQQIFSAGVTGKSDLYCYFYIRGLQLLRECGSHVFICSNAWLDAGYGTALQDYLLNSATIIRIIESEVERQFSTADINTVITFLAKGEASRSFETEFVTLLDKFSKSAHDDQFQRIRRVSKEELRCEVKRAKSYTTSKTLVATKLGGKFLRAPEIFDLIMDRAQRRLATLGEVVRGERYLNTGGADGFFIITDFREAGNDVIEITNSRCGASSETFVGCIERQYLKPIIKDATKRERTISVTSSDALCIVIDEKPSKLLREYIAWGERAGYHRKSVTKSQRPWYKPTKQMLKAAPILVPRSFNQTFVIHYNPHEFLSLRFYRLHPQVNQTRELVLFLNSTLMALIIETLGNRNLGQGVLDFFMADFLSTPVPLILDELHGLPDSLLTNPRKTIFDEYGVANWSTTNSATSFVIDDRRYLDSAVFDALRLTSDERDSVYEAVIELVTKRLEKAKSTQ